MVCSTTHAVGVSCSWTIRAPSGLYLVFPFLYIVGLYLPLSLVCIPMVYRRKRAGYKAHLGALLLLIMASTASLIVQCVNQGKAFWNMEMELIEGGLENLPNIIAYTMQSALIHDFTVLGIYIFSKWVAFGKYRMKLTVLFKSCSVIADALLVGCPSQVSG